MLPLYKIFSLIVRVFTRPLVNYTKKYHVGNKDDSHRILRAFFKKLGNFYHRQETKINRKFLQIASADELFIKALADDVAIEKGIEFFYEICFYAVIIGIPLWEMYKAQASADKKALDMDLKLGTLENNILNLETKTINDFAVLNNRLDQIEKCLGNNDKTSTELARDFNNLKQDIISLINKKQIL